MEARENDIRFSELLIAAHKYLADGGDPARLTLGVVVQRGTIILSGTGPGVATIYMGGNTARWGMVGSAHSENQLFGVAEHGEGWPN
jgi:hypothetical protein